jgi:7,8-dihydroneopterin aldolase/epimerase/oxygenase
MGPRFRFEDGQPQGGGLEYSGPGRGMPGEAVDRVILSGIRCWIRIGVTEFERQTPQECRVDVEMEYDLASAMRSDDLRDSLDYAHAFAIVREMAQEREFALLEGFAGALETALRRQCNFAGLTIRVKKLHPPFDGELDYAGIEVRRP